MIDKAKPVPDYKDYLGDRIRMKDNIGEIVRKHASSITVISKKDMAKINQRIAKEMEPFIADLKYKEAESEKEARNVILD